MEQAMAFRFNPGDEQRQVLKHRLQGAAVGLAAGALVTCGAALASVLSPRATGTTIHGCVAKTSRTLTVPKAGGKCPAGTTALSWNVTGPAGKTGPAGAPGS